MTNSSMKDPALEKLIHSPALMKLWDFLKTNCAAGNKITIVQTEVALDIGVTRVTVCKGLKELERLRFVVKNGKHGTANVYMLNPNYMWKGKLDTLDFGYNEFCKLLGESHEKV